MLILTRRVGETIQIGQDVTVRVVRVDGEPDPPRHCGSPDVLILREELVTDRDDAAA